jgi:hypothetical protein
MASAAHLIIDGRVVFNTAESYYRMFSHEMSTKPYFTYNLSAAVRIPQMNFELLLDTMINLRKSIPSTDNFVVVEHGEHLANDFGLGLAIPMTRGTKRKALFEDLATMLDARNKGMCWVDPFVRQGWALNPILDLKPKGSPLIAGTAPGSAAEALEKLYPAGDFARVVDKMRQLQQLKVRCVELRACTLGTNPAGLATLGQCFGARFIVAPDRHFFFVHVDTGRAFHTDAAFNHHVATRMPLARRFVNPRQPTEKLAISILRGAGITFNTAAATNTTNLKWFVDTQICADNRYVNGARAPAPFFLAGMDLGHGQYALPQEQTYRDHLVEAGPLQGNLI